MLRANRLSRAAFSALVALVAVLGLTAVPASAVDVVDYRIPNITVGNAVIEVNPGTPIFTVEVVWPLSPGLDCTDPANAGAQLRWRLHQPNPNSVTFDGFEPACTPGDTFVTDVRHLESVKPYEPDRELAVMGELDYAAAKNPPANTVQTDIKLSPTGSVRLPKAPVWIGVGDGYTSATWQDTSPCTVADAVCAADLDKPGYSWVVSTIDRLRSDTGVTDDSLWDFEYVNVAKQAAKAGDMSDAGAQAAQLAAVRAELDARKPVAGQAGSWNWVGLTGGLVDSGITTALSNWYTANPTFSNANGRNPWVTSGGTWTCPAYGSVPATVASNAAVMQDGLLNIIAAAVRNDPNVRIVHPLYPNIVDGTLTTSAAVSCRLDAVAAIGALNTAVARTSLANRRTATNRADLSADELGRVYDVSMVTAFGDPQPTGNPAGIVDTGSMIQLAKPWGYPYPSDTGTQTMGNAAVDVVFGLQDVAAPSVTAVITADTPQANEPNLGWYRGPVSVKWKVSDPADNSVRYVAGPHFTADGEYSHIWSPEPDAPGAICSLVSGKCAASIELNGLLIDSKPPVPGVKYFDAQTQAEVFPNSGWFNKPVTVRWVALNDHESDALNGRVSGLAPGPAPEVTIANDGQDQPLGTKQLCDNAGNCISLAAQLSYDGTAPGVSLATTPTVPGSGWFNKSSGTSVSATWTGTDSLSGFVSGATTSGSKTVTKALTLTTDGNYPLAPDTVPTFTDKAGNSRVGAGIKVDRTDPTVKLFGGPSENSQTEISGGESRSDLAVLTCTAADATSGVFTTTANPAGCTATQTASTAVTGGVQLTYTVTATDKAGNAVSVPFSFTALGVQPDSVAPMITLAGPTAGARYVTLTVPAATCTGTDPSPGSGFKSCDVETLSSTPLPLSGPPGRLVTIRATGQDNVGNTGVSASVTYTVFDITPKTTGSIYGKGAVLTGFPSASEFSLPCGGGTSQLDLTWWIGTFHLTSVDKVYCWDDTRYSEGSPDADIDSIWLIGKGRLLNGRPGTIELTLTDRGEPGRGRDTLSFVVKDENGVPVLSSTGTLAGGGNVESGKSRRNVN